MDSAERAVPWGSETGRGGARAVLDALWEAPVAIALVDRQLRLVRVNATMARITGVPADEHVGRAAEELAGPVLLPREVSAALESGAASAGLPASAEWPPGSGEIRHWLVSHHPVRAESGGVVAVGVVAVEVTGWRRAEDAAREASEEAELAVQGLIRLQAVTASLAAALTPGEVAQVVMEQGVGLLDAAAGSVSWTSGADELEVLDAFGYPERPLVAWRRYAVDLPAPLAEAFRTGQPVWLESPDEYAARYPQLAPAARPFHGATVAVPLVGTGGVFGVLGIDFAAARTFEPADRSFILAIAHQTAQALERARLYQEQEELRVRAERTAALLDTLFSSVPIGLAFVDWDLRLVHVNAAWARLHGAPPDAFLGKVVGDALPGPSGRERMAGWRRVLTAGEPVLDLEESRPDPDDPRVTRTWLESWYPVVAGGDTIGIGVVAREITAARRAEEFRRNLLGIVGHDLRNPLNAITGFAHLLRTTTPLDERQLRMVGRVEASAAKAARIAHDLLDLTRIESAHGIPVDVKEARIDEVCAAVAAEAETAAPGREIRVAGRGDPSVRCDPDRVSQALSNLVVNALKHGAADRPVEIQWDAGPAEVTVTVRNWGPPVPDAVVPHLFEPFRQGTQAGARASGLGLGLYITREIMRAHGGTIEARSNEAEGTAFTLRLPRDARSR